MVAILDSGPDGGNCPAAGDCRGFNGTCADVVQQFADVPILPDYTAGMADYLCNAFPMDDKPVDRCVRMQRIRMSAADAARLLPQPHPCATYSFIVGLISLAVGLPVVLFLQTAFAIANDSEAPESWLEWPFTWRKLVFGFNAHRQWHYTGPAGQPNRHVRWFVRSVGAPPTETALNLAHSAAAAATCSQPPWTIEAREAAEDAGASVASADDDGPGAIGSTQASLSRSSGGASAAEARELARHKRVMATVGVLGVYLCWAVFSWCVVLHAPALRLANAGCVRTGLCSHTECLFIASSASKRTTISLVVGA